MVSLPSTSSNGSDSDDGGSWSADSGGEYDLDPPLRFEEFGEGSSIIPRRCSCGLCTVVRTCWENENPDRWFISCRLQKVRDGGCSLLRCVDPPLPSEARRVILELRESEAGLLRLRDELHRSRYKTSLKLENLEADFEEAKGLAEFLSDLDVKNSKEIEGHLAEKNLMKKLLLFLGLLVVVLVIGILFVAGVLG